VSSAFDLDAYLARLAYDGPRQPGIGALRALHFAHVQTIPFENLNIQLGLPVTLDIDSLQRKMVRGRRGGYCFEHNTLVAHALAALGFTDVMTCEARVRQGMTRVRPRTHMVLVVTLDGVAYLADVGFGADGLMEPIGMDGSEHEQYGFTYRVAQEDDLRVLQRRQGSTWEDLYAFRPAPVLPIDFEVGNWFCSTYPASGFVTSLTAQRCTPDARHILRGLTYTVTRGEQAETREISRDQLVALLRDVFLIDVPDDASFRAIDH
jgi:N-hydroxyarylamine O-acetyltransferase